MVEVSSVPKALLAFKDWTFSSGSYTGPDFRRFSRLFRNYIAKQLGLDGLTLVKYSAGHYDVSGFVKNGKRYMYFSLPDVRHFNNWYTNILIRTAKSDTDYHGGPNQWTTLDKLLEAISGLLTEA